MHSGEERGCMLTAPAGGGMVCTGSRFNGLAGGGGSREIF